MAMRFGLRIALARIEGKILFCFTKSPSPFDCAQDDKLRTRCYKTKKIGMIAGTAPEKNYQQREK